MLKTYLKPEVSKVEMRPIEAALMGCKAEYKLQDAACLGVHYSCIYPNTTACNLTSAS
jgi:hypothetical protein